MIYKVVLNSSSNMTNSGKTGITVEIATSAESKDELNYQYKPFHSWLHKAVPLVTIADKRKTQESRIETASVTSKAVQENQLNNHVSKSLPRRGSPDGNSFSTTGFPPMIPITCNHPQTTNTSEVMVPCLLHTPAISIMLFVSKRGQFSAKRIRGMLQKSPWKLHHKVELRNNSSPRYLAAEQAFYYISQDQPLICVNATPERHQHFRVMILTKHYWDMVHFYRIVTNCEIESCKPMFCVFSLSVEHGFDTQLCLKQCHYSEPCINASTSLVFEIVDIDHLRQAMGVKLKPLSNNRFSTNDPDGNHVIFQLKTQGQTPKPNMENMKTSNSCGCLGPGCRKHVTDIFGFLNDSYDSWSKIHSATDFDDPLMSETSMFVRRNEITDNCLNNLKYSSTEFKPISYPESVNTTIPLCGNGAPIDNPLKTEIVNCAEWDSELCELIQSQILISPVERSRHKAPATIASPTDSLSSTVSSGLGTWSPQIPTSNHSGTSTTKYGSDEGCRESVIVRTYSNRGNQLRTFAAVKVPKIGDRTTPASSVAEDCKHWTKTNQQVQGTCSKNVTLKSAFKQDDIEFSVPDDDNEVGEITESEEVWI